MRERKKAWIFFALFLILSGMFLPKELVDAKGIGVRKITRAGVYEGKEKLLAKSKKEISIETSSAGKTKDLCQFICSKFIL